MSKTKERWLYATRDGNSETIEIFSGLPKSGKAECDSCGGEETQWVSQRGSRYLTEVCDSFEAAAGVEVPPNGIVKFKIVVG